MDRCKVSFISLKILEVYKEDKRKFVVMKEKSSFLHYLARPTLIKGHLHF